MLHTPGRRLCGFGPGPACQTSATAMARDTSRSWRHIWEKALLEVNSEERRKEDPHMEEVQHKSCPRHTQHMFGCLCCYACWHHSRATPTSPMPDNDLVHLRRMLVAAIRVLQLHNLPVDARIVSTMLGKSLEDGVQMVPRYVSKELRNANRIDSPVP